MGEILFDRSSEPSAEGPAMKHRVLFLVCTAGVVLLAVAAATAAERSVPLGARIDNLAFKDIRYLPRSLDDFPRRKGFVVVFASTTCPVVQRYLPTLRKLEKDYRDKGVQFLAVNTAPEDSIRAVAAQ